MRNEKIDLLRFIGLAMIILAHVDPPSILFQLRNFDVPLMVLVSGMSFGFGYRNEPYFQYLWKRIKRLVFPVWIFLTAYFSAILVFSPSVETLNFDTLFNSYFFIDGIGYVWIIRVFLLVALVSPPIYVINQRIRADLSYLVILLTCFLVYEVIRFLAMPYIEAGILKYLSLIFFYITPYSFIFALGLRIPAMNYRKNLMIMLFSISIFFVIAFALWMRSNGFVQTQEYKYPPSLYYFSYAVSDSIFIWTFSSQIWKISEQLSKIQTFVLFVAQNSLWIYLWHIPLVKLIDTNFLLKYLVVCAVSIIMAFIQVWVVQNILIPKFCNKTVKKNLKVLFTG